MTRPNVDTLVKRNFPRPSEVPGLTRGAVQTAARSQEAPAAPAGAATGFGFQVVAAVAGSSEEVVGSPMSCEDCWILPTSAAEATSFEPGLETRRRGCLKLLPWWNCLLLFRLPVELCTS